MHIDAQLIKDMSPLHVLSARFVLKIATILIRSRLLAMPRIFHLLFLDSPAYRQILAVDSSALLFFA
jgi:hypothetical protein